MVTTKIKTKDKNQKSKINQNPENDNKPGYPKITDMTFLLYPFTYNQIQFE